MTDNELLAKAAKACGYKGRMTERGLVIKEAGREPDKWVAIVWNPLTNDGDALRLAVQMRLTFAANTVGVIVNTPCGKVFNFKPLAKDSETMMRAARLAITQAASECEDQA